LRDDDARILTYIEDRARDVMLRYNVSEIRIPLLERIELYQRSSGETSDIVEKQMYTFRESEDGTELAFALRPEGTPASSARISKLDSTAANRSSDSITAARCFAASVRKRGASASSISSGSRFSAAPTPPATPS